MNPHAKPGVQHHARRLLLTLSAIFLSYLGVLVPTARAECGGLAPVAQHWPEFNQPYHVDDYVAMINNLLRWEVTVGGATLTIEEAPGITDLGSMAEHETLTFTVTHWVSDCPDRQLTVDPSSGSVVLVDRTTNGDRIDETYQFSATSSGDVVLNVTLDDGARTVLMEGDLGISVLTSFWLGVSKGTGVAGIPHASQWVVENAQVEYGYTAMTCYGNLLVQLDSAPVANAGSFVMDQNHNLNATADLKAFQVDVSSGTGGTTDHDGPNTVDCDGSLLITAIADDCYAFQQWSGDASGSSNPLSLENITENMTIVASFQRLQYQVTVTSTTGGSTDADGTQMVDCDDSLTITATAEGGYAFSGWTGDVVSTVNPLELTGIRQDYDIQANFQASSTIDLGISQVKVIQGISMAPSREVRIAQRPTVVRVFCSLTGASSQAGVTANLTRYVGGLPQDTITPVSAITLPATVQEGNLSHTLNFSLPSSWLTPGTSFAVQLDPNQTIAEFDETNNRYPASGAEAFDFVEVDPVEVVVVPVPYQRNGSGGIYYPNTSNISYFTWMPFKVWPVHQINYTLHATLATPFTGDLREYSCWSALLDLVEGIHDAEDPGWTKLYYGLVNFYDSDGCPGGCIAGLGNLGWRPTAVGFSGWGAGTSDASETFTHEAGHNFGRNHSPCGNPANPDPGYPYSNASIGQWGLDVDDSYPWDLYNPSLIKDYMSYCSPVWTSDYTYRGIHDFRLSHPWDLNRLLPQVEALSLVGSIFQEQVHLLPLFSQTAPLRPQPRADLQVTLFDSNSQPIGTYPLMLGPVADVEDLQSFSLAIPAPRDLARLEIIKDGKTIFVREVDGAPPQLGEVVHQNRHEGGMDVLWQLDAGSEPVQYRVRFSADGGGSWWVFSPMTSASSLTVPNGILRDAAQPLLEIQATDGLRTSTRQISLK